MPRKNVALIFLAGFLFFFIFGFAKTTSRYVYYRYIATSADNSAANNPNETGNTGKNNVIVKSFYDDFCWFHIQLGDETITFDVHESGTPNCEEKFFSAISHDKSYSIFQSKTSSSGDDGIRMFLARNGKTPYITYINGSLVDIQLTANSMLVTLTERGDGTTELNFYDAAKIASTYDGRVTKEGLMFLSDELHKSVILNSTGLTTKVVDDQITIKNANGESVYNTQLNEVLK